MKTPKEKAKELYSNFEDSITGLEGDEWYNSAKQCALIAVENELRSIMWLSLLCTFDNYMKAHFELKIQELKEVKTELENL